MLYFIFLISGAAALIYQVLWTRLLSLSFGVQALSITIVLSSFMLGLALGAFWIRKYFRKGHRFLHIYAILEAAIGVYALLFPKISHIFDWAFEKILSEASPNWEGLAIRIVFSFCLLLPPTILMGATLPLVSEHIRLHGRASTVWHAGFLYAANTLGAVLGAALSGFVLIEVIGIPSTLRLAALLNFMAAFGAWQQARLSPAAAPMKELKKPKLQAREIFILLILAVSGAAALASEILWTRTLEILIGNSTYAFTIMLLAFLIGIAMGSAVISIWVKRLKDLPFVVTLFFFLAGLWNWLSIHWFEAMGLSFYSMSLKALSPSHILLNNAKCSLLLLPLAFLSGGLFPVTLRLLSPDSAEASGDTVARASQWNTLGAVAGALITGFFFVRFFDYLEGLYFLSVIYGFAGLLFLMIFYVDDKERRSWKTFALLGFILTLCVFSVYPLMHPGYYARRLEKRFKSIEVVFHKPGLQGITTVLRRKGSPLADQLLVNGRGMTRKISDTKMMAHLPLLVHPNPKDVLVICFGMGTTYRSSIRYGVQVIAVELLPEVLEAFEQFYDDATALRKVASARMLAQDGRNYLKLTKQRFDVITLDPPPPIDGAGVGQLYSKEFALLARSKLKPGGVFAHWIPFPGSRSGVDDPKMFETLINTVASAFPYVATLPGYHHVGLHILGSNEPLTRDRAWFEKRLKESPQAVIDDLQEWDPVDAAYLGRLQATQTTPIADDAVLTDQFPTLEFYLWRLIDSGEKKEYPQVIF